MPGNKTKLKFATFGDEIAGNSNSYDETACHRHSVALRSGCGKRLGLKSDTRLKQHTLSYHRRSLLKHPSFYLQHLPYQSLKIQAFHHSLATRTGDNPANGTVVKDFLISFTPSLLLLLLVLMSCVAELLYL